jgi:predicted nucleic acid-binding protein
VEYALADTGVWYAVFDRRDAHHAAAQAKGTAEVLELFQIVLPWPTLSETLRTKFVRNSMALGQFERFLKKPNVAYLDDSSLREAAVEMALESSIRQHRPLSMVDCLIRLLLEDVNTRISCLATFNERDFADVCRKKGIEII